jgi:ABC-type Na+ efflux pump permease subunit
MLRTAFFIARHDALHMLREKETLVWLFVMPLVFTYFIGTASGGFRGARKDEIALVAPPDAGFLAERVVKRLTENDYEVCRVASQAEAEGTERRLELPARFTETVLAGEKTHVVLSREHEGISADYDKVRVGRAVYTTLADVVASAGEGGTPSLESMQVLDAMPRMLSLEVSSGGTRREIPGGFQQTVPGTMVMFTLIALLTSGAVLLVIERRGGLLRRLSYTPLPRSGIVLGKWLGKLLLGAVQIAFAMTAGTLLFRMHWGPSLPMVLVVLVAWATFCASAGLFLGSLARTEGQAVGIGVLTTNVLAALGGCWWPIEVAPRWMQSLAKFLPTGWAMDAMHRLVSFQAGAASAIPHALALFTGALVLGVLAKRRFRFA